MTNKQAAGVQNLLNALRSGANWVGQKARSAGSAIKTKAQDAGTYVKDKALDAGNYVKNKAINTYNNAGPFLQKHRNAAIGTGVGLGATGAGAAMLMGRGDSPAALGAGKPGPNLGSGADGGLSLTPGSLGAGLADMLPLEARNYLQQTLGNDGYVRAMRGLAGAGIGAGVGLGAGALGSLIGPKKKRHSILSDALTSALIGGGLGGAAGAIDPIYGAVSNAMGGKPNAS